MKENKYIIKEGRNYYQLYNKKTNKVIEFDFGTKFYYCYEYDNYIDIQINRDDRFSRLYDKNDFKVIKFNFGTKFHICIEYDNYLDILINENDKFKKYDKKNLKEIT